MKIKVRNDAVMIDGYVNAIERYSKPLPSRSGVFVERIAKGAFTKALERNDDVKLLLDHDYNRELGSMKRGNLELIEDSIGLKAHAEITDPDVIEQARNGDLVGWSFGFSDVDVTNGQKPDVTAEEQKAETAEEPPAIEVEETETAEQSEQAESVEIDYSYYENILELLRG